MKKSPYFAERLTRYLDEIDDLMTDSEGKSVLQRRLGDKRGEMDAILPMIDFSPEMVAVVFYDGFAFRATDVMQRLVLSEPGHPDFPAWRTIEPGLAIEPWAQPLIASTLKAEGGDAFLVATAALEFLRGRDGAAASEPETERTHDDEHDDGDTDDLGEAGADWLAEQGFETLDR